MHYVSSDNGATQLIPLSNILLVLCNSPCTGKVIDASFSKVSQYNLDFPTFLPVASGLGI